MCTLTARLLKLGVMSYGHNGHYLMNAQYISVQSTKMLMSGQNKTSISLKMKHNHVVRLSDHLSFLGVSVKWQKLLGDAVSLSNSRN